MTPIRKLFIANRAEIALRIVRTARRLGIATVVPWHAAGSPWPGAAGSRRDACSSSASRRSSAWLDVAGIVRAARDSGCDAVHPGYGFLSENAAFARAVAEAGLVFVGPGAAVIELMGDKISARRFAVQQGVPVTPSADEADDPASFAERARAVGFPLLIKGAAGGGGKGMQIVRDAVAPGRGDRTSRAARASATSATGGCSPSASSNGRGTSRCRSSATRTANVIHLGERECSIQRRFQKLIEETPAPGLDAGAARAHLRRGGASSPRLPATSTPARWNASSRREGEFFFLEMNTRLQVEHPVTEMVTGLDLVEWQLRVAAGEPLPLTARAGALARPRDRGAAAGRGCRRRLRARHRTRAAAALAAGAGPAHRRRRQRRARR